MNQQYTSIKEITVNKLEEHLPELQRRFGIECIGIFGSVSRGEDTQDSDIDTSTFFRKTEVICETMPVQQSILRIYSNAKLILFHWSS